MATKKEQKRKGPKPRREPKHQKIIVEENGNLLTFGGHLEVFRRMLFRIIAVAGAIAMAVFCFKETTWEVLLAPSEWDFCTYRWLETAMQVIGVDFRFEEYHVNLIATDLSSQFMTHITTAVYLGLLFGAGGGHHLCAVPAWRADVLFRIVPHFVPFPWYL